MGDFDPEMRAASLAFEDFCRAAQAQRKKLRKIIEKKDNEIANLRKEEQVEELVSWLLSTDDGKQMMHIVLKMLDDAGPIPAKDWVNYEQTLADCKERQEDLKEELTKKELQENYDQDKLGEMRSGLQRVYKANLKSLVSSIMKDEGDIHGLDPRLMNAFFQYEVPDEARKLLEEDFGVYVSISTGKLTVASAFKVFKTEKKCFLDWKLKVINQVTLMCYLWKAVKTVITEDPSLTLFEAPSAKKERLQTELFGN